MDNRIYWVWLSLCFSYGSGKPQQLAESENPVDVYANREKICESVDYLTPRDGDRLQRVALDRAEKIVQRCDSLGIRIVTLQDSDYPQKLRQIYGAPLVLYVQGDISCLNEAPAIAAVGTRKATQYGKSVTGNLCYQLALTGVTIVSGCAVGIDEYAHRGALKAGGKTVGVLGCGHDIDYPAKNRAVKEEILRRGGALIGELPPGTAVSGRYFPVRNRILAGLSDGVLVTEAPVKSGALITARLAVDLNRDLFCVPPYNIYDTKYTGVVPFLREGAKAVFDVTDILEEYLGSYEGRLDLQPLQTAHPKAEQIPAEEDKKPHRQSAASPKGDVPKEKKPAPDGLTEKQRILYDVLGVEPVHADDLAHETGWAIYEVLSVLTELELLELVTAHSGRRYSLT